MVRRKNKNHGPKRKRMSRRCRLNSAKKWVVSCKAKNIAKAYRKWYGVDYQCAFTELEMIGVKIDPQYKQQVLNSVESQRINKLKKKQEKEVDWFEDSDENFAYIAGYTSGGVPYGVRWEEL